MRREVGRRSMREGTCVCLWMIHVDVWQKSSQYCKVIILKLKIKQKKFFNCVASVAESRQCVYTYICIIHYISNVFVCLKFFHNKNWKKFSCFFQNLFEVTPVLLHLFLAFSCVTT